MSGVFLVFIFAFAQSNFGAAQDHSFFKAVREGHMVIKCEEKVC